MAIPLKATGYWVTPSRTLWKASPVRKQTSPHPLLGSSTYWSTFALWFSINLVLDAHAAFQILEENLYFNSVYIIWVLTLYETFFARNCLFSLLILIELIDTLFYSLISGCDQLSWVIVTCPCNCMINTFIYLTRVTGRSNKSAEIKSSCLPSFSSF